MISNVMVDLETLGTRAGCVILSIGAVAFDIDKGVLGAQFYKVLSTKSCEQYGLRQQADTAAWWKKQSPEARKVLEDAADENIGVQLKSALSDFNIFLQQFGKGVKVWGNGADFDNPILANAYAAANMAPVWRFWDNRCYRTLKALYPEVEMERTGTYHNALDDAKSQAEHALKIFKQIANNKVAVASAIDIVESSKLTAETNKPIEV